MPCSLTAAPAAATGLPGATGSGQQNERIIPYLSMARPLRLAGLSAWPSACRSAAASSWPRHPWSWRCWWAVP
ncbi:hypothetical protein KBZ34_08235 [Cyanobium sp. Cruz-8H5]|nr:hypothetical protein [Cyanobium sp. Cruz-8H5]